MTIRYAITDSAIGRVLVAATGQGICAIALGADDATLEGQLGRRYPGAALATGRGPLARWTRRVVAQASGRTSGENPPLDIKGTPFQQLVWRALRAIPRGETRTYGDVARAIGRPTAARAVARACATNPVAVAVPCHRVVPASGGLGGYRWGVARKKALLQAERAGK